MKKLIIASAMLLAAFVTDAQQLNTPQASPTASFKQNFSTGSIELNYSRPGVKGRKIFGDLVPFGKVWRTGANNATTISFTEDVMIGGKTLKAGKYGILTIPNEAEWTIIFTTDTDVTSPAGYKMDNDVVRVSAKTYPIPVTIESFTIGIGDISSDECKLTMMWDKTYVEVPITTDTEGRVMKQIDQLMNKDNKPYYAAASFYYDNGKDLDKAAEWAAKAVEQTPNYYWVRMLQARILAKKGDKVAAKAAAQKVIELATAAKNDDYVKLGNDLIKSL